MRCEILTGPDTYALLAARAQLITGAGAGTVVEGLDLEESDNNLLTKASSGTLFGPRRVLDVVGIGALTAEVAAALAGVHNDEVTLLLRGESPVPAAIIKAFAGTATVRTFPLPTGATLRARIGAVGERHQIHLSPAAVRHLETRAGTDVPKLTSAITAAAMAGLTNPSPADLDPYLGSTHAAGTPWAIAAALYAGDLAAALALAEQVNPVAVVSYLANRTGQAGRILDDGMSDTGEIAGAFGLPNRAAAAPLAALATRLGPAGVNACWQLLSTADRDVKLSPYPSAILDVLLVRLCALWSTGVALPASSWDRPGRLTPHH